MTTNAQRRVVRAASASLLAAGLALSSGMSAMAASSAPARVQAAERAQPTPPPPPEVEEPVDPPVEPPVEPPAEPPVDPVEPPVEPPVDPVEPPVEPPVEEGEQENPPEEGEQENPPEEGEQQNADVQGVLPTDGEDAPAVQNVAHKTLSPTEIKKQVDIRISDSNLSAADKAKAQAALNDLLTMLNNPNSSKEQKEIAESLATGMGEALRLSKDPTLSKAEQARFDKIARGISEAATKALNAKTLEDFVIYGNALEDLDKIITNLTDKNVTPQAKVFYAKWADVLLGGLVASTQTGTAPTNPVDKKKVQEKVKKNVAALKVYQSADSSPEQRSAAKATLDEQAGAVNNSQYQELVEELKRLKAPQSCLDVVQNRTQQAGWPDGSLWGLTDKACEDTVQAGAADTDSDWNALFECVLDQPFSSCTNRIPE